MPKSHAMTLRLDEELHAKAVARAQKLGISLAEMHRRSLAWLVEQPIRSTQTTERF